MAEASPEKAGVGGSTPSLATISINSLQTQIGVPRGFKQTRIGTLMEHAVAGLASTTPHREAAAVIALPCAHERPQRAFFDQSDARLQIPAVRGSIADRQVCS